MSVGKDRVGPFKGSLKTGNKDGRFVSSSKARCFSASVECLDNCEYKSDAVNKMLAFNLTCLRCNIINISFKRRSSSNALWT
jgi:hypothetical protein